MDDILDELGGNVTYQDLYKIHTGHGMMNGNSDTDTSSELDLSNDDNLKPPPYTYEELTQNLVPTKEFIAKEFDEDLVNMALPSYSSICSLSQPSADKNLPAHTIQEVPIPNGNQPVTQSEKIVRKLSQLITTESCFICDIPGNKHYKQPSHYKNVIKWLETETKEIKPPVDFELFFCQICNLPLSGNKKAKAHYKGSTHQEKAKSFCVSCQRVIEAIDMPNHCKSRKHMANIETPSSPKSKLAENKENPSESAKQNFPPLPSIAANLQDKVEKQLLNRSSPLGNASQNSTATNLKSYACVLRGATSNENTTARVKTRKPKKSEPSISPAPKEDSQFIRTHILPPVVNPFAILLIEQLRRNYCYLCDESVSKERGSHYKKRKHYTKLREWIERDGLLFGYNMNNIDSVMCFACHCIFPTYPMAVNHYRTKEHEKLAQYYCDVCMYHDNSDIHKEHKKLQSLQKESKNQKACEPRTSEDGPGAFIAKKLKDLTAGVYCFLCKAVNDVTHELTKVHLKNVRRWLEIMIQNTGVKINRRFLFCEDCSIVLSGTNESQYHFETDAHLYNQQTYCPVCMFRASPEDVAVHIYSEEHNKNLEALLLINMPIAETIPNVTSNQVVNGCKDDNTSVEKEEQKKDELNGEMEKTILKIESPKLDLNPLQQNASDSEIPTNLLDHQNMNLIHLGLQLGQFSTDILTNNEHADVCKDICAGYWQLVTMLEIVPLEVCSSYLKKFNKDIGGVYKEYLNNLNKDKVNDEVISRDFDSQNVQNNKTILQKEIVNNKDNLKHECLCESINCQMTKISSIVTKCLSQTFNNASSKMVQRLRMLVRNFRIALEGMKTDKNGLKMENIFYCSSEPSTLEENLNAVGYEIYKYSLTQEIEQLRTFTTTTNIKPSILLDCLLEFGKLLKEDYITVCKNEEKNFEEYFYVSEVVADDKVNMEATTNNDSPTKFDEDNGDYGQPVNTGSLKDSTLLYVPKAIESDLYSNTDLLTEKDSDSSFESTVECLCEGWCLEKTKN